MPIAKTLTIFILVIMSQEINFLFSYYYFITPFKNTKVLYKINTLSRIIFAKALILYGISPLYINHHRHIDIILNLFIPHFLTLISKHYMPMKMPKPENFNEILSPRAVVECSVFSGFTSPLIRFILLVAFVRIKDFYISFLCIDTTLSTCPVLGNISTHPALFT